MTSASLWNPGADVLSVNANTTLLTQIFTATDGQTDFILTAFEYAPATGSLLIFRNGQLIKLGVSETSSTTFSLLYTDLNAGDELLAMGFVGITATTIDLNAPFSHAVGYLPQSVGTKLQLEVNLADAPFNVEQGDDISAALQAAVDLGGVHKVIIPSLAYNMSTQVIIRRPSVIVEGQAPGMFSDFATKLTCTADIGTPIDSMFYITPGMIGSAIGNLNLKANSRCKRPIHMDVLQGGATHYLRLDNIYIDGHIDFGILLGSEDFTTLCDGQLSMVRIDNITIGNASSGAIAGLGVNAQNLEVCSGTAVTMVSDGTQDYHIYGKAGGISIKDLVTTGAAVYGIRTSGSQIVIGTWRTEDRLLVTSDPVGLEGPCSFRDILHRASTSVFSDLTIDWSCAGGLTVLNANIKGSVAINPTQPKQLNLHINFLQKAAGAGYLLFGPQNNAGTIVDSAVGDFNIHGTTPALRLLNEGGDQLAALDEVGVRIGLNTISYDAAAPTTGARRRGDIVFNITPSAAGNGGWICISSGTPGTWKTFATIAA